MPVIPWEERFSVHVQEIDAQHQRLLQMIDDLHTAMTERRGREVLLEIVERMIDYARSHFATEEAYMERFKYPGYVRHRAEHAGFSAKAVELHGRLRSGALVLSLEVINFLREWVTNHILVSDQAYSACFRANGLK